MRGQMTRVEAAGAGGNPSETSRIADPECGCRRGGSTETEPWLKVGTPVSEGSECSATAVLLRQKAGFLPRRRDESR